MDEEEILLHIRIRGKGVLDCLREEDRFYVLPFIKHVDTREDWGVLEGGKTLLMSGSNVGGGHSCCSGGSIMEVSDVLCRSAIEGGAYGG